jgi:RNA recognition motif-containing protein
MNPIAKIINDVLVKNNGIRNIPKSIRLGNLPRQHQSLTNELRRIFAEIGTVVDVYVPLKDGVPIGYGFVEFTDAGDAIQAVAYFCRGLQLDGNKVRVELAEGKRKLPVEQMTPKERLLARSVVLLEETAC